MKPRIYVYDMEADSNILVKFMTSVLGGRYMAMANQEYPWGRIVCHGCTINGTRKKALKMVDREPEIPKLVLRDD